MNGFKTITGITPHSKSIESIFIISELMFSKERLIVIFMYFHLNNMSNDSSCLVD